MNKNKIGFAWLLLTLVMIGMSQSAYVSNSFTGIENVDSTEIVVDMDNEYESEDMTHEEQTKKESEQQHKAELLLPTLSAEEIAELEQRNNLEESLGFVNTQTDARAVDAACTGDYNLDLNGDDDLDFYDGNSYMSEPDLAPELLEDFQSDDDYEGETGLFGLSDSVWSVRDEPYRQDTPESGQDREVVVAGSNEYLGTQEAFLRAATYTVRLYDTTTTPWNSGAIFEVKTPGGQLIDSATKTGWGAFVEDEIEIPSDGVYIITLSGGSDSEDQYYELLLPEYVDPTPPPSNGGFVSDPTPFTLRPGWWGSTSATKTLAAGEYTFNFRDDWGDGWNGGQFYLRDNTNGQWIFRGHDPWAGLPWWAGGSFDSEIVTLEHDGDYFFWIGGGSYPTEMTVEVIANDVAVKSEFYMAAAPYSSFGDGSFMTTTCINAGDYNEIHVSFGYFMDGNFGVTSGLSLDVKAEDDRDGDTVLDFYSGSWQEVWSQRSDDVDPTGDFGQDFWFTANLDISSMFCDDVGCATKLSFRFNFDNGPRAWNDDYAIDNFRVQGYGQFSDFDKDGVPDIIDDCDGRDNNDDTPNNEPTHTMFDNIVVYEENGCPVDTDQDGVFDLVDWCPSTPSAQVAAGLVDSNGCGEAVSMSSFTMSLDSRVFENSVGYAETFNDALNGDADPMNVDVELRQGWNVIEDDGIFHWQHYSALNPGTFEGERSIVHAENNNDLVDSAWLISPHISIPASSEFGVKMNFAIMNEWQTFAGSGYDHSQGEFAIYASDKTCQTGLYNPGNGNPLPSLMEQIYLVPDNLGYQLWSQHVVDIPEEFYGSDVCFAFHNAAPGSGTVFVDFFQFYEQPTPPDSDGDGVWDAYPTTEVDGVPVYGANAGQTIDLCDDTPYGQSVVGMTLGVVNGQPDKPLATQPFDVGCNAPISVPYSENFNGVLNMPAGISFGTSNGDGVLSEGQQWETLWSFTGQDGQQGIIRADDGPSSQGVTQYLVLPMMEIDATLDAAVLTFLDLVPDNWQWDPTSYHGIHVSVPDKSSLERSCEVGEDQNQDKIADAIPGVNDGYKEVASFIGENSAWEEKVVDLSAYVGDWVCVAFAFRSENDQNWYVDSISVEGVILPPDLVPPTVSEFTPYTGVNTYRADGRLVEITLADSESGIDDGTAATGTYSKAPKLIWSISDTASGVEVDAGEVTMSVVGTCDVSVLPYLERECSFEGMLPEIPESGHTMEYSVQFQDIGFKTAHQMIHPTTGVTAGCMNMDEFINLLDDFSPQVPDENMPDLLAAEVCGGPNVVTVGPYSYSLLDPTTGLGNNHHQASMMNVGISGIDDGNGGTYDVHLTYFSDVHEYVLEYDGDCVGNSGVRTNNWLSISDSMSISEAGFNQDTTADCGNVVYNFDTDANTWMVAQLDSQGIDYNHNGLDAEQRDWADWTQFLVNQPSYSKVIDMPTALTDVNDIVSGNFARHTFSDSALTYDILLETDSVYGDYLTTSDGMTLYVFWGDTPGQPSTCDEQCLSVWPAFYAGDNPSLGLGLDSNDFGTSGEHTTYKGYPLYTYVGDTFPTDIRGDGLDSEGGIWHVATSEYADGPIVGCQDTLQGGAPYSESILLCAGAYSLVMEDSYGDGWNGNEFVMTGDGVSVTATIDFGDTETIDIDELATDTQVSITVGGGSYASEVSWELIPRSTELVISASQSTSVTEDLPAGTYLLEMTDSWGDGWNGNQWTLVGNGLALAGPFTIASGSSSSATFTLTEECLGCVAQAGGGSYINEIAWTLSLQADDGSGGSGPSWAEIAVDFPGVLEGGAPYNAEIYNFGAGDYSLSMTDSYGDGWNGNMLALVDEDGNVIVSEGLSNGREGTATFTLDEAGTYALDVGVTMPGDWDSEVGWSLIYEDYLAPPIHFTQLCVTSNGAIALTNGEDCTTSSQIINQYGWNGFMYQDSDTGILSGGAIYAQVQNILPQKILDYSSENYITTNDNVDLDGWEHTVFEDTSSNDGSMTLNLERMHPINPGLYYKVVSADEESEADGCNYDLYFDDVTDGGQSVGFSLIPDATTNAPDDEKDMLQAGGIHQSTLSESGGYCDITIQLMEDVHVHDEQKLRMVVQNIPEERPDYSFSGSWDYELVDAVLPGTVVPVTVEVQNNDDGISSMGGSMYDHGHSLEVCFSTNDFDDCYYNAWIINPPAPGASVAVEGQFVLDAGTELVTTNLEVHTCSYMTMPGSMDNQDNCELDQLTVASYNGITRKGAKVTAYQYAEQPDALEQLSTDNDMSETDQRPIRIAYGVANSVPSFAPSMMAIGFVGLFAAALVQGSRTRGDEEDEQELFDDEAAVSPVIATILMVAITVVLSGVIYVWASQLATTSTKVTPLLTFKTEASVDGFWEITVTTAENPLALQAIFVQVEFIDDRCEASYCIITQTLAEPQSYGFTTQNSDSFVTYMDMYDCNAGEGTDGCTAEFSAMDLLRINFNHPDYGLIDEGIVQLAYQIGGEVNVLGEWTVDSSTPSIK